MDNRKQDTSVRTINCSAQSDAPIVHLTPPTDEEEKFLQSIERVGDDYDRTVILGGPRRVR